jgi:hypothetical protein
MVTISIPVINKHSIFVGDGETYEYTIDYNATDIEVMVSGLYLTNGEDFSYEDNTITLEEIPEDDSNINIKYKV